MVQKQVQGVDGFAACGLGADYVGQADLRVRRPQHGVRRLAGPEVGDEGHGGHQHEQHDEQRQFGAAAHDARQTWAHWIAGEFAIPNPRQRKPEDNDQAGEPSLALMLACSGGVHLVTVNQSAVL